MPIRGPHLKSKQRWLKARKSESRYGAALRKLANFISHTLQEHPNHTIADIDAIAKFLTAYSDTIDGWANAVSRRMLAEVNLKDARSWEQHAQEMGLAIQRELRSAPTGAAMMTLHNDQVSLIKSLPLDAATKAQAIARESLVTGERMEDLRKRIQNLGDITKSRATLIARTEVSKAHTALTQARAEHVGSEGYIWRTVGDYDVRPSHKRMEGKFIRWDQPPEVDPGYNYHAGAFPNCRCWPEPVLKAEAVAA